MDLEKLVKELGLEGDDNKDKVSKLRKEFNSKTKEINELTKKVTDMTAEITEFKGKSDKFENIVKSFGLDMEAKDIDVAIEECKEAIIKEAGGATSPDEVKTLKRDLTKAQRERDANIETVKTLTDQLEAEKDRRITTFKRDAIQKGLSKVKALDPEQFTSMFMNKVLVDDDGKTLTMKNEVGEELSLEDALVDWAKNNPNLIQAKPKGGAGTGGNKLTNNKGEMSDFMKSIISSRSGNADQKQSIVELFG